MNKLLLTSFVFLILTSPKMGYTQDTTDYRTYSIVLGEFLNKLSETKNSILIQSESDTVFYYVDKSYKHYNLLSKHNKRQIRFENLFKIKNWQTKVITKEELESLTIDENEDIIWDPLYAKYPEIECVIFLSSIYYTKTNKLKGFLQVGFMRNGLNGGYYLIEFNLKKNNKKFKCIETLVN
ncbi:MAG: hypothetical protein O9302_16445 [Cyclobacteriaceae bacterium]|nr:hypothetical protein [Cytophagales bacterium]MCZ8329656.1 hypothetical protein [Cyclobacteriaceae bacterium]